MSFDVQLPEFSSFEFILDPAMLFGSVAYIVLFRAGLYILTFCIITASHVCQYSPGLGMVLYILPSFRTYIVLHAWFLPL